MTYFKPNKSTSWHLFWEANADTGVDCCNSQGSHLAPPLILAPHQSQCCTLTIIVHIFHHTASSNYLLNNSLYLHCYMCSQYYVNIQIYRHRYT